METIIPMIVITADGKTARALWYGSNHRLKVIDPDDCEANAEWERRWMHEAADASSEYLSQPEPGERVGRAHSAEEVAAAGLPHPDASRR